MRAFSQTMVYSDHPLPIFCGSQEGLQRQQNQGEPARWEAARRARRMFRALTHGPASHLLDPAVDFAG